MSLHTRTILLTTVFSFLALFSSVTISAMSPVIIGVAGGSGSGKSYFANELKNAFLLETNLKVTVISQDWYYKDQSHLPEDKRALTNFDHPESLDFELLAEHLQLAPTGKSIKCPQYDFVTHTRTENFIIIEPADIYIVEGILLFSALDTSLFTKNYFIECPEDLRLRRRIARDIAERGRTEESVLSQFETTVKPMHDLFVEPCKTNPRIEIISGTEDNQEYIKSIVTDVAFSLILV